MIMMMITIITNLNNKTCEWYTYDFRLEWRLDLPLLQILPLDIPEEGMVLDGLLSAVSLNHFIYPAIIFIIVPPLFPATCAQNPPPPRHNRRFLLSESV
jgi:hypothetical protein